MSLLTLYQQNLASGAGAIEATANQTLATVTQSATLAVTVAASASQTLASVSQAATAAVVVEVEAAQTLAAVTQSATVEVVVAATASQTLASVGQTAIAGVVVGAEAAQTLDTVTQSAALSSGTNTVTASQTLADLTQAATLESVALPTAPPQTGGAMVLGRAGSGRWRRVDDDTVYLRARSASGRGRTKPARIEIGRHPVALAAEKASAQGRTGVLAPVVFVAAAARGRARTSRSPMTRDDTLEVLQIYELMTLRRAA